MKTRAALLLGLLVAPGILQSADRRPSPTPAAVQISSPTAKSDRKLEDKFEGIFSKFLRRQVTIEKVKWRVFPIRFTATNIKLMEDAKTVLAEGPTAVMTVSLKTLTSGRIRVSEMSFPNAVAHLRYNHDGTTNLTSMIKDLSQYARANYKPGQKQKVAYNIFRIENARIDVTDNETGEQPLGAALRVDARGDISGLGPQTQFPFHLNAVLQSSTTKPMSIKVNGLIRNQPQVHGEAKDVPINIVVAYLPIVRWFSGIINAEADFSKAGAYTFWKIHFVSERVKANIPLPFPNIKVEGFFHPYVPSNLKLTLTGKPTKVDVTIHVKDFRSKKVKLAVQSKAADINECIQWSRTAYWLNEAPETTMNLPPQSRWPVIWQITGTADIDANLVSVMGPQLIQKADGVVKFKIEKGRLAGMPGLVSAFALLNLTDMLGDPTRPPNGLEFETVNGEVDINNGIATTKGLIMLESPSLSLGVTGQIDFANQMIHAKMLIGVANLSDAVVVHIPLIRRFKSGNKKGVIPIWLSVDGPINNPNIKLLPIASFDRGLWKFLPAPLQIPEKILNGLYDKKPN